MLNLFSVAALFSLNRRDYSKTEKLGPEHLQCDTHTVPIHKV